MSETLRASVGESVPQLKRKSSLTSKLSRSSPVIKRKCNCCEAELGLMKRKRKCKMCSNSFCSDCCSARACYPLSYGFNTPKWACNECMLQLFSLRTSSDIESPSTTRAKSPAIIEGSYHTCEDGDVHAAFKMADPVCRLFFRFAGMHEGGKFDRSTLQKAMTLNKALVKLPSVAEVSRHYIPVPLHIPEDSWNLSTLYSQPPFIKRKKRKRTRKNKKNKKNKQKKKNAIADLKKTETGTSESHNSSGSSSDIDIDECITEQMSEISVFVYKPKKIEEDEKLPVVIWYHGGGFCIGSIEDSIYEWICRTFANRIHCIVVSVEYRLAPEFTFPIPLEDCYWALLWVYHQGETLFNADVSRISVAGDSAGGSLSSLMCIMTKLRSGPIISHQVLVYPCLANPCNDDYESQVTYKNGPLLTRKVMEWFMGQCLGDSGAEPEGLFPLLMDDSFVEKMPPATIINAQHDPLLDHGSEYFQKLQRVGVPVRRTVYSKSIHGFFGSQIGESDEAIMDAVSAIKDSFALTVEEENCCKEQKQDFSE